MIKIFVSPRLRLLSTTIYCNMIYIPLADDTPMVTGGGAKVFYFPDEKSGGESSKPSSQVISDLGDVTYLSNKPENDTDDEFCFLGDEPGMGRVVSTFY